MYTSIFKNTTIFLTSFYLADKLNKSFRNSAMHYVKYLAISLVLSIIMFILKKFYPYVSYFVPVSCFVAVFYIIERNKSRSIFCLALASYVINLLNFHAISFLLSSLLTIIWKDKILEYAPAIIFVICTVYPFLIIYGLKKYRIYKGVSSLVFSGIISYNTFACIIALITLTLEQTSSYGHFQLRFFRVLIVLSCLIIIQFWWRTQITKSYREKLRLLEIKSLRDAKAEDEAYITKLEAENKRLGTIIHKDNRIVNAMADSVSEYLSESAYTSTEELATKGASLAAEITSMRNYRQELLLNNTYTNNSVPETEYPGINAIISFMIKEAASYGITLKFYYDNGFFDNKHYRVDEMDLVHLLSDVLENAIIATRLSEGKIIELSLQILKGIPTISISDSGIPFEIDTYMKFGNIEASTHLDTGGSGIGLMDIWSFKKKYHASLVISELDNSPCTKRITFLLDNKNKYLIVSKRYQEIISKQIRADLMVIETIEEITYENL